MADDKHRREYPQHARTDDHHPQPHPSIEEARHGVNMAASVTLPSIQDPHGGPYPGHPPPLARTYPPDSRYAPSANGATDFPPPPHGYLAPLQTQSEQHRPQPYSPADHRGGYYDDRRPPPPPPPQYSDYPADYYYRQQGPPPPNGYPRDYRASPPGQYPPDFGQGIGPPMAQAAPRQRTSIACRYCRKRKIRCSGYQSAPGGKCQNCARMNQECIFQPVSSSSSTAFVPLSAVQGGVPPGTQLFGAYGQPLAPNAVGGGSQHYPPHHPPGPPPAGPPPPGAAPPFYSQAGQSPIEPYAPYGGEARDDPSLGKRPRDAIEQEEWRRQQAPRGGGHEDDGRRRSPAEFSSQGSPGGGNYPYGAARHSPRAGAVAPGSSAAGGPHSQSRSPGGHNNSSGSTTPVRQQQPAVVAATPSQQAPTTSKMSLSNLVDKNDIDKTMIDRLNRPRDGSGTQG